jgi:hypothetical protein
VSNYGLFRGFVYGLPWGFCVESLGMEYTVTYPAQNQRKQQAENDRREIAKRVFDALCARYPDKYITLVQPCDSIPAVPNEA